MGFRPLHDRVLVRRVEADEKTAGGIIIPDTAKEKPQEGEVVAVGGGGGVAAVAETKVLHRPLDRSHERNSTCWAVPRSW